MLPTATIILPLAHPARQISHMTTSIAAAPRKPATIEVSRKWAR